MEIGVDWKHDHATANANQIMHYSRIMPLAGGQRYHTSTSVFLNEVIKLTISLTMVRMRLEKLGVGPYADNSIGNVRDVKITSIEHYDRNALAHLDDRYIHQ